MSGLPARRRFRPIRVLVAMVVIAALIGVGAGVVDAPIRAEMAASVRTQLVQGLQLDARQKVDVTIGGGPAVIQFVRARLDQVTAHIDNLAFGSLVGSADLTAKGVPFDATKPIQTMVVDFTVPKRSLSALDDTLGAGKATRVSLRNNELVIATVISIFGASVPVSIGIIPSAREGQLVLTPDTVTINGVRASITQLKGGPFSSLFGTSLQARSICVARFLPKKVQLSSVTVDAARLRLHFVGDGLVLGGSVPAPLGTCAAG